MPLYHRGNGLPAYVRTCPPLLTATWYRRSDYYDLASHEKLEESHESVRPIYTGRSRVASPHVVIRGPGRGHERAGAWLGIFSFLLFHPY